MFYKMEVFPAIEAGNPSIIFKYESMPEMLAAKNTVADLLLFMQDQANVMDDFSNMLCMERQVDGEWVTVEEVEEEE